MLKVGLILSLVINIGLIGYLFAGKDSLENDNDPQRLIATEIVHDRGGIATESSDHLLVLNEIESQYPKSKETAAVYYWESPTKLVSQLHEEQTRIAQAIRADLLAAYGDAAISQLEFESYFFPLGPGFEFLSSEEQIQISELQGEYRSSLMSIKGGPQSLVELKQKERMYLASVRSILSEDEFFEFQLRESKVAQQMRSVDFDWTESEFREVYRINSESNQIGSENPFGLSSASSYSEDVRDVLGGDRYIAYLEATDSTYSRLSTQVQRNGGSEEDAENAYRIYSSYGEQISEAMQDRDLRTAQQLQKERDQAIQNETGVRVGQPQQFPFNLPRNSSIRVN